MARRVDAASQQNKSLWPRQPCRSSAAMPPTTVSAALRKIMEKNNRRGSTMWDAQNSKLS